MSKGIFSVPPKPGKVKVSRKLNGKHLYWNISRREVAIEGPVVLEAPADSFFGGPKSRTYRSPVLNSPSWGKVFSHFNKSIPVTRDGHHIYLEGVHPAGFTEDGNPLYRFSAGS